MDQATVELSKKESNIYTWVITGCIIYVLVIFAVFNAGVSHAENKQELVDSESYLLGYEAASLQCMAKKEKGK